MTSFVTRVTQRVWHTRTPPENRGPDRGRLLACELAVRDARRDGNPDGLSTEYHDSWWLRGDYADINEAMRNTAAEFVPTIAEVASQHQRQQDLRHAQSLAGRSGADRMVPITLYAPSSLEADIARQLFEEVERRISHAGKQGPCRGHADVQFASRVAAYFRRGLGCRVARRSPESAATPLLGANAQGRRSAPAPERRELAAGRHASL